MAATPANASSDAAAGTNAADDNAAAGTNAADDNAAAAPLRVPLDPHRYQLTRFLFLRLLGLIHTVAFLVAEQQLLPLVGSRGLQPARAFLEQAKGILGDRAYLQLPTLFWLNASDGALRAACHVGLALALLLLAGYANALTLLVLWALYLSIVQVGQVFWGYGWESLLLETSFLSIFLLPAFNLRPFRAQSATPKPVIWLMRWLLFRLMLGAGLIKLRGDPCWRDLTCMMTHYETQPLPNPVSWYLHQLPKWAHQGGVLFNHFAELIAPFALFAPRRWRRLGAATIVLFQLLLIVSGNLSWLNWLTITLAIAAFDDAVYERLIPAKLRARVTQLTAAPPPLSRRRRSAVIALVMLVGVLSINPVINLLSPGQQMNRSFDPLSLVNTYGAFGSVNRERYEIVLQGTLDDDPESAHWLEYSFRCKPGDVMRRPCVVAPYHLRIDWQMWFAAMSTYREQPWVLHLAYQLLTGNPNAISLIGDDPFHGRVPKFVRAEFYRYEFTAIGDGPAWWRRSREGSYFPALSKDDTELITFLQRRGWLR
jgi:hypothetical protein